MTEKDYIVVIEETWFHYLKMSGRSKAEAIEKVDGGKEGEHVKVEHYTKSITAWNLPPKQTKD